MKKNLLNIYHKLNGQQRDYIVFAMRFHSDRERKSFFYGDWPLPNALLDTDEVLKALEKWPPANHDKRQLINTLQNYLDN